MSTIEQLRDKLKKLTSRWYYLKEEIDAMINFRVSYTDFYQALTSKLNTSDVVDNLTTDNGAKVLSAKQGKVLNDNKEDNSNKVTSVSASSTDTEYPSAKAVYDILDGYNSGLSNTYQTKKVGSGKAYENKNVVTNGSGNITVENKPTIPSKTSDLTNDSNFLTSHQDISGKEDASNKSSSITSDTGSTTKYPTVKAVEDYAQPIGNYLTSHQSLTDYIQKSQTNGLVKNDGSIDTTSYSTFSGSYNDLSNKPSIPSDVSDLTDNNDTPFTPKTHNHGNITTDGKVGSNADYFVTTTTGGAVTSKEKLGYITTNGAIGSVSGKPIKTGYGGVLVVGEFGTSSGTFAEGNHTHSQYLTSHQDISGKADISDFDTLTATVNYTDNTSETVTFYIAPNNSS